MAANGPSLVSFQPPACPSGRSRHPAGNLPLCPRARCPRATSSSSTRRGGGRGRWRGSTPTGRSSTRSSAPSSSPGRQLSENELAAWLGVSRTPVREALARLREEGLVEIVAQLGTFVAPISPRAVTDAQFVREALECAAVRKAAELATDRRHRRARGDRPQPAPRGPRRRPRRLLRPRRRLPPRALRPQRPHRRLDPRAADQAASEPGPAAEPAGAELPRGDGLRARAGARRGRARTIPTRPSRRCATTCGWCCARSRACATSIPEYFDE